MIWAQVGRIPTFDSVFRSDRTSRTGVVCVSEVFIENIHWRPPNDSRMGIGDWGFGIWDWGMGNGEWGMGNEELN